MIQTLSSKLRTPRSKLRNCSSFLPKCQFYTFYHTLAYNYENIVATTFWDVDRYKILVGDNSAEVILDRISSAEYSRRNILRWGDNSAEVILDGISSAEYFWRNILRWGDNSAEVILEGISSAEYSRRNILRWGDNSAEDILRWNILPWNIYLVITVTTCDYMHIGHTD